MTQVQMMLRALLFSSLLVAPVQAQNVNARAAPCLHDSSVTGYTTLQDINKDQFDELERIRKGTVEPRPPYSFVLCPKTIFDATHTTLSIVLSGSVFSCGSELNPSSSHDCSFRGGLSQVFMADLAIPNYELERSTMIGVTFEHFNGTSLDVKATELLTLTLSDVVWKNFYSDFVVAQHRGTDGTVPARVDIVGATVHNGFGGSLFSNNGGVLSMDHVAVSNVTCAGLVATSNGGVAMIQSSSVSRSVIDTVGSATMGSTLTAFDLDVYDLVYTYTAFSVQDAGSVLLLNRTQVRDLKQEFVWTGVMAEDSASAILDKADFTGNRQFQSLVHARTSATIEVIDSSFENNVGRFPASVSNVVFALMNSVVNLKRSKFVDNTQVSSLVFAYMKSTAIMEQLCFFGGSSDQVAFSSSDSAVLPSENYVSSTVESTTCPGAGIRLSVEQPGSQCYQEGGSCDKTCALLADQANCVVNTARISPEVKQANGTATNATAPPATTTTAPLPNVTATVAPTVGATTVVAPGNATGNMTIPEIPGNETSGNETIAPSPVRIFVAWSVRNDMMITDPQEVLDSGLSAAFPVFVESLVANLTTTARRQLMEHQRRRLEVSLVPDSAVVYEVINIGCSFENRTTNMTSTNFTQCHEAMGRYDLMLTADEDPVAIRTTYTRETRDAIDDGTFQDVLLEVQPDSPLLLGPSIEARPPPTMAPSGGMPTISGPPLSPTFTPKCSKGSRSKSSSKSSSKKSKSGSKGKGGGMMGKKGGAKMMRRHSKGYRRNLNGHVAETEPANYYESALKEHDGGYYSTQEYVEEEEEEEEEEEVVPDECEEPEEEYHEEYEGPHLHDHHAHPHEHDEENAHARHLQDQLPRIHGSRHGNHQISELHAEIAAELNSDENHGV